MYIYENLSQLMKREGYAKYTFTCIVWGREGGTIEKPDPKTSFAPALAHPPLSKLNQDGAWASSARPRAASD